MLLNWFSIPLNSFHPVNTSKFHRNCIARWRSLHHYNKRTFLKMPGTGWNVSLLTNAKKPIHQSRKIHLLHHLQRKRNKSQKRNQRMKRQSVMKLKQKVDHPQEVQLEQPKQQQDHQEHHYQPPNHHQPPHHPHQLPMMKMHQNHILKRKILHL